MQQIILDLYLAKFLDTSARPSFPRARSRDEIARRSRHGGFPVFEKRTSGRGQRALICIHVSRDMYRSARMLATPSNENTKFRICHTLQTQRFPLHFAMAWDVITEYNQHEAQLTSRCLGTQPIIRPYVETLRFTNIRSVYDTRGKTNENGRLRRGTIQIFFSQQHNDLALRHCGRFWFGRR